MGELHLRSFSSDCKHKFAQHFMNTIAQHPEKDRPDI